MGSEKRGEVKSANVTGLRVFAGLVVLLIVTAIGGGLYLSGSPGTERAKQFDSRRLNDLQQISGAVDSFYGRTNSLPENLDVLISAGGQDGYLINKVTDPRPDRGYVYEPMSETDYRLCATFDLPSDALDKQGLKQPPPVREPVPVTSAPMITEKGVFGRIRTWEHPAGEYCFQLNATDQIGSVLCGLQSPCQAGQTCAELPKNKGTRCVPAGWECQAAGCPGKCTLAESYPVQVRCAETNGCQLMKDKTSGDISCFGCANGVCRQADNGWETYTQSQNPDYVGIPYACFAGPKGCELAQ